MRTDLATSRVFQSSQLGTTGKCEDASTQTSLMTGRDRRMECAKARVHIHPTAGISGGKDGARSIVMSGGYKDDVDNGDTMCVAKLRFLVRFISSGYRTYTGAGGYGDDNQYGGGSNRSWGGGMQVADQSFKHKDNAALFVRSHGSAEDTRLRPSYRYPTNGSSPSGSSVDPACPPNTLLRPGSWLVTPSMLRWTHSPYRYRYDGLYKVTKVIIRFRPRPAESALTSG